MTLKEIHKEIANLREEMLTNLVNFAADIDEKQKAKALRKMKKDERKARVYNLLKFQRKKSTKSGGIDRLEVPASWPDTQDDLTDIILEDLKTIDPKDSSKWKEVNCPQEIEFYL